MNLALRGGGWPFGLEKWYLDALLPDGRVLLVYLVRARVCGVPMSRVTAEFFQPGQEPIRGEADASSVQGGEGSLIFGPASIEAEVLRFSTPGLSGELRYRPRMEPLAARAPFVSKGRRGLTWSVEVPDAEVTGRIEWPGGEAVIEGRGYRDRVWMDLSPWGFPIRELRWGRAVTPDHSTTWVWASTVGGLAAVRWTDGVVDWPEPPELGEPRVLLDTHIADIEGLGLGWLRAPLRALSGDPHEVKWAAPVRLAGQEGVAIHERVVWGS